MRWETDVLDAAAAAPEMPAALPDAIMPPAFEASNSLWRFVPDVGMFFHRDSNFWYHPRDKVYQSIATAAAYRFDPLLHRYELLRRPTPVAVPAQTAAPAADPAPSPPKVASAPLKIALRKPLARASAAAPAAAAAAVDDGNDPVQALRAAWVAPTPALVVPMHIAAEVGCPRFVCIVRASERKRLPEGRGGDGGKMGLVFPERTPPLGWSAGVRSQVRERARTGGARIAAARRAVSPARGAVQNCCPGPTLARCVFAKW
jgi:hypothetical protein